MDRLHLAASIHGSRETLAPLHRPNGSCSRVVTEDGTSRVAMLHTLKNRKLGFIPTKLVYMHQACTRAQAPLHFTPHNEASQAVFDPLIKGAQSGCPSPAFLRLRNNQAQTIDKILASRIVEKDYVTSTQTRGKHRMLHGFDVSCNAPISPSVVLKEMQFLAAKKRLGYSIILLCCSNTSNSI